MRSRISTVVDRRLEDLIVAWTRRQWPASRLVPAGWLRPLVAARALRLRRSLVRVVLVAVLPAGVLVAVLI